MALEDLTGPNVFICDLVRENPEGTDPKSQGDDHIRGIKNVLLNQYPNVCNGAITWTVDQANAIIPALLSLWNEGVGQISTFPVDAASVPHPYLPCDGRAINRGDYPILFALLGSYYGDGDTVTTFNIPDYRGTWLRCQDDGAGVDPDVATRTAYGAEALAGDNPGSKQAFATGSHSHDAGGYVVASVLGGAGGGNHASQSGATPAANISVSGRGGSNTQQAETRPINTYGYYCIKADRQDAPTP